MLRQFSPKRIIGFALFDWLGTLLMLVVASYLRVWLGSVPSPMVGLADRLDIPLRVWEIFSRSDALSWQVFILVSLIWPVLFMAFHVYDGRYNLTIRAELLNIFLALFAATLTLAGLLYFTYQETSRILFVMFFFLDTILLLGARVLWWIFRQTQKSGSKDAVLIIGAGNVGKRAAEELRKYNQGRFTLVGFVDDAPNKQSTRVEGLPILGTVNDLPRLVNELQVHDAVVALPLQAHEQLVGICHRLQNLAVRVHVIPDLFALSFPSATLDGFGGIPMIDLGKPGIYGWRRLFKRIFDGVATCLLLALVWPLMLVVAVLIKLDSPGPIFYRQKRIGENGQPFYMLKFRSMKVNNDDKVHREYMARLIKENLSLKAEGAPAANSLKMQKDPRITRVGRFIRKTSIDELPQLFNVLFGEMSLVGPRPPIPYEVEMYQEWHKRRLEAIPGVTGLWQVQGRNRVSFDEMVRMDLDYIEHQSLWLDTKLLLMTPFSLLSGQGAG
jgi:exopolysaccharide biosynthesis polyprenyl glycosylphosphotransferase